MEGSNESDPVTVLRTYNDDGNLLAETNPLGVTTAYTYDPSTRLLQSVTRPMGANRTQYVAYERNAQGSVTQEVVRETNSSGAVLQDVRFENYDTYGNPQTTRILDIGREIVWGMAYDALHQHAFLTEQTVQVKDVNNNTSTITQQAAYHLGSGRMTAYTDGKQQTTAYAYDTLGRIVQAIHPDQSTVTLRYDDYGNRLRIVDEAKIVAITTWNPVGWKLEEGIEEAGTYKAKAKYGYDSGGRLIWSEDAIGNRTEYAYDARGRHTQITYADGFSATTVYHDINNMVVTTDPEQNTFRETFDKLGRLVKREEVKPGLTIEHAMFTYDHVGNILTAKDAKGYITTYHYDTLGRLTGVTNPKQEQTSYSYDRLGNLTTITYADQNTLQKRYDELGRLIQRTDPKGNEDKYFYDANHNLVQRIDRKGQTFTFVYSNRDFLVQKISQDETIGFGYDAAGKRTHMTDATGTTQYAYQPYTGQLRQVTYPDGRSITYDYNPNGQRRQMTDPFGGNVYYHYDERNRLLGVGASPDLTQADATYSYYKNGLLQQITQQNGVTSSYSYNGLRLETLTHRKADNSLLNQYLYSYDLNGNQTSKTENGTSYTYTYDELNRIATSEPFDETYTYDARGNRSALEQTKPLNLSNLQATYDDRDRLTHVTVDGQTVQYRYNGDNLLVERIENGLTTRYYYDGAQIIAEATVVGGTAQLKARYIRGRGLVSVEDAHLAKAYYLHNGHGDVVELRDPTGTTRLNTYTYDIWGNPIQEQAAVHNPFRYSGELWDDTTQLQYLRARWYDPSEGRFMNEDPYEGDIANPLSLNLFTYVHNNPLISVDPTGYWCTSADGNWAHPGGCNGGVAGQEVFHDINGSIYTPDADHHNQWIMENGVKVDRYYHPGVGMTLWDLTGKPTFGEAVDTVLNTPDWFPMPQLKFGSLVPKIGGFFKGIGNAFSRSIKSTSEMDTSVFKNLKNEGVIDAGRSGSNRPLTSTPNSYYKTQNGNIIIYDNNGKLMYDISPERVKMFDINKNPQGREFFNPRKLDGTVPKELLEMLK